MTKLTGGMAAFVFATAGIAPWMVANVRGEEASREPLPVEELFQSTLVYTEPKGEVQLVLGSFYRNGRGADVWGLQTAVEYGLTDHWQIEVEWQPWLSRRPDGAGRRTGGVGDVELATLYSFMNLYGSDYHAALSFEVEVPTASVNKELGEGFMEYAPSVIVARDFPAWHRAQLFSQLGLGFEHRVRTADEEEEEESAAHSVFWNAGAFVVFDPVVLSGEVNWKNNRWNHDGEENEWYLTPGVTWKFSREFQAGVAVPVGLNTGADRYRVMFQAVAEF